ncbi:hypothetical protein P280DRAFT_466609 [Massarina eburnea CBS 473.64]|uniref:Uncharacterized protein n=1 Tax=Massarina eburnea CBS 473.64 TaxID=1395130 RepID=A0A6A6S869_9PLEO|nr:hypothetical protein P280DRAFT_466609 [Massarina eburnea CBS 473.64]
MSLYDLSIVPIIHGLKNTAAILQKGINHAKATNTPLDTFLTARLHSTMEAFPYQIHRLTDSAKGIPPRLNPSIAPLTLPDVEVTFADLLTRIKKTIEYLEAVKKEDIDGKEGVEVTLPFTEQKFTGLTYVGLFALPNFWFHVTVVYGLLRKEGVDVGKSDYLNGQTTTKVEW